jgi:RNA polymerase sigma-54 factor
MSLSQNLQLKLQQKLVMTQALQQAIRLLQLNHIELVAEVQKELVENPTLEEIPGTSGSELSDAEQRLVDKSREQQQDTLEQHNGAETGGDSVDWEKYLERFQSSPSDRASAAGPSSLDDLPPIETNLTRAESLSDHLLEQLGTLACGDDEARAARVIIHNLDYRGYLDAELPALAEEADVSLEVAEDALEIIQSLDPLGCGARDLVECLVVQARARWPEDPAVVTILQDHIKDLETRNYQGIARALGQQFEDVLEYHRMIRELDPRPGLPFADGPDLYITPDIDVEKVAGKWQIRQNDDGLPRLRVSPYYRKVLLGGQSSPDERKYIKERLESADFLIRSIYKRQRTIHKVMKSILDRQQDFFDKGPEHLRPMILRDVADEVGVHESTVSRVTTNKYVSTPHGIFELKYFFNAGISTRSGDDLAGEAVKQKIQKLVAAEDPRKPLSDAALVKQLKVQGITIARRTVAKYREQLGILSSRARKRLI